MRDCRADASCRTGTHVLLQVRPSRCSSGMPASWNQNCKQEGSSALSAEHGGGGGAEAQPGALRLAAPSVQRERTAQPL